MNQFLGVHEAGCLAKVCKTCEGTSVWNGNVADRSLGVHEADRNCDNCLDGMNDREEVVNNDEVMDGPSGNEEVPEDGDDVFEGRGRMGCVSQNCSAVGRIRTYAPRGKLISSQSP